MPLYEYKCNHCDHEFETLVKVNGKSKVSCPNCKSQDLSKLFSAFAFKARGGTSSLSPSSGSSCSSCSASSCTPCGK